MLQFSHCCHKYSFVTHRASFSGLRPLPIKRSLRCCCRFPPGHYCSTRSGHPTVSAGMRTLLPYPSDATVFSSESVSSHTVTASVAQLWLFLPPDAVLLNIPGPQSRWHTVHQYAAGLQWGYRWAFLHAHRGFSSGHEPYTRLPLFCRIRITPGNHRKHRPEAHRCNRPDDSVDGYLSGPGCMRTRPTGASPTRHYGHHGRRPTAWPSGFYRCLAPGPCQRQNYWQFSE